MKQITIFGFGSLLEPSSLYATAPNASHIESAYIQGFIRCFDFWDEVGYTQTNLDVAGEAMCALNIHVVSNLGKHVNGVVFNVPEQDFERLKQREAGYKLITTPYYDFKTGKHGGICQVFSADATNGTYDFSSAAQERYLENCLKAARRLGDKFYNEFLETTLLDGRALSTVSRLAEKIK